MRPLAIIAAALLLAACATFSRLNQYEGPAAARKEVGGYRFEIWVHPVEDVVLIQRGVGGALKDGFVSGLTYGMVDTDKDPALFRQAGDWLVKPVGCHFITFTVLDKATSYEAQYQCPADVDLRALVNAQAAALRQGQPLHR